jgi:hypothetical protein
MSAASAVAVSEDVRTSVGRRLLAAATVLEHEFRGPQVGGLELLGWNYGEWTCAGFWMLAV